jgi:hypothetical protein
MQLLFQCKWQTKNYSCEGSHNLFDSFIKTNINLSPARHTKISVSTKFYNDMADSNLLRDYAVNHTQIEVTFLMKDNIHRNAHRSIRKFHFQRGIKKLTSQAKLIHAIQFPTTIGIPKVI